MSRSWPRLMLLWNGNDKSTHIYGNLTPLYCRLRVLTVMFLSAALVDNILYNYLTISHLPEGWSIDDILKQDFSLIFTFIPYSTWTGLVFSMITFTCRFTWTYGDLLLMIICTSLAEKYRQINKGIAKAVNTNVQNIAFWKKVRQDYGRVFRLCQAVDDHISNLLILSFANNILVISMQLYISIKLLLPIQRAIMHVVKNMKLLYAKHSGCLSTYESLKFTFILGKCFGMFPMEGLASRNLRMLKFRLISIPTVYTAVYMVAMLMLSFMCTFTWNYTDLFIILLSTALTSKLNCMNYRMRMVLTDKSKDMTLWNKLRHDFNSVSDLCKLLDHEISDIVFLSFGINLFIILVQLYNSLKPRSQSVVGQVYFMYSFMFLIFRAVGVLLYGSSIHEANKETGIILMSTPSDVYNPAIMDIFRGLNFPEILFDPL
ncbi:gustatory receptor for sugar taste 64e-like [Photinus pyralis]|uniref:gustatory receptor for sugar taste 64e-like n=1 Tax=Photinus pyralis TaxID=7054 RepID=UPI0012673E95|nr:gustatory receptor for sugar taste 64e-like [Photinus pyralis]